MLFYRDRFFTRRLSSVFLTFLLLSLWLFPPDSPLLTPNVQAGSGSASLQGMQLLNADSGWVLTEQNLLWTTNKGSQWTDITPAGITNPLLRTAFFLNTSNGWVLNTDFQSNASANAQWQMALTADGGNSWAVKPFASANSIYVGNYSGKAWLDFVDNLHGWAMLSLNSNANFSMGDLFTTSDGGNSWTKLPSPPIGDAIHFSNTTDGWLAGGADGTKFYTTKDGGNSWQPQAVYTSGSAVYGLPVFQTAQDGILPVVQTAPTATLAFYATHDGGQAWNLQTTLPLVNQPNPGVKMAVSVVNATTFVAVPPEKSELILLEGSKTPASLATNLLPKEAGILKVDFKSATDGWVLTSSGQCVGVKTQCTQQTNLFSVSNSQTLTDITPNISSRVKPGATQLSTLAGFDQCAAGTAAQMQTWWNNSPYKNANIYMGGSYRACAQANLNATWVSQVFNMGWGLIPTWVGPQAPCNAIGGISTVTATAQAQGVNEANAAADTAVALGLTTPAIVYYDIAEPVCSY